MALQLWWIAAAVLLSTAGGAYAGEVAPLAIESSGRFLYLGDAGQVFGFGIDLADGRLTPVPGSPFRQGGTPAEAPAKRNIMSLAPHPSGRFLYALTAVSANVDTDTMEIWVYSIDRSTGALVPVPGTPFARTRAAVPNVLAAGPPMAAPAIDRHGALQVLVVPFAEITIDDGVLGRVSSGRFPLTPGSHVVVLSHPEYHPLRRRVTVLPGATEKLVVDLSEEAVPKRK